MSRRPKALFVLPAIPDDLDEATKNRIALRNRCSVEMRCPSCGCTPALHADVELEGVVHVVFEHEAWCCVGDGQSAA